MPITSGTSGTLDNNPAIIVNTISPDSRLVKSIIVTNLDTIDHVLHLNLGYANTIVKVKLSAGDCFYFNSVIALAADNLVGYVEEAISVNNLSYVTTYLDESETV